jgi:tRNA-specific adenosine deaminase 3
MVADTLLLGGFEQLSISARSGSLVPLKTKDEVRAALETFEAYILEVPARWAGAVKELVNSPSILQPSHNFQRHSGRHS